MVYGKRTALIELNGSGQINNICKVASLKNYIHKNNDEKVFKIHGVDYYGNVGQEEFADIYARDYNYLVIDFGAYSDSVRKKLVFCTDKCLIANHTMWKNMENEQAIDFINEQIPDVDFKCFTYFGEDYDRKVFKKIPELKIPRVEKQQFPFFVDVVKE